MKDVKAWNWRGKHERTITIWVSSPSHSQTSKFSFYKIRKNMHRTLREWMGASWPKGAWFGWGRWGPRSGLRWQSWNQGLVARSTHGPQVSNELWGLPIISRSSLAQTAWIRFHACAGPGIQPLSLDIPNLPPTQDGFAKQTLLMVWGCKEGFRDSMSQRVI